MLDIPVTLIRSDRWTFGLYVWKTGEVFLRCPLEATDEQILRFYNHNKASIEKQVARYTKVITEMVSIPRYSSEHIRRLAEEAVRVIPERAKYFAPIVGVTYGRITIRYQKTRWGSCSIQGNLNFNCLLMDAPPEVLDFVVVHELCHRIHMDHSPAFWAEVARVLPNYGRQKAWLETEGTKLMLRMMHGNSGPKRP